MMLIGEIATSTGSTQESEDNGLTHSTPSTPPHFQYPDTLPFIKPYDIKLEKGKEPMRPITAISKEKQQKWVQRASP